MRDRIFGPSSPGRTNNRPEEATYYFAAYWGSFALLRAKAPPISKENSGAPGIMELRVGLDSAPHTASAR